MTVLDAFNLKILFPIPDGKYSPLYYIIGDDIILSVFTILFCMVGLVGNGMIVWLLGFCMKRKPFAIYILHLAMADFGSLAFLLPMNIYNHPPSVHGFQLPFVAVVLFTSLFGLMTSTHQLLLTAISIDRWVSVLFPNWYQSHRSPALSTTVCSIVWVLAFAIVGVPIFLYYMDLIPVYYGPVLFGGQTVITLFCLFLVILSILTLFIKVCLKRSQRSRNLLNVILLMLLSFLLFTILTCATLVISHVHIQEAYFGLWASLKDSINPLIYFLAGRGNCGRFQERMKVNLQRVFKEEKHPRMELQPYTQTMF